MGLTSGKYQHCNEKILRLIKVEYLTIYRNGYAKFEVGNEPILHPFDADGMITAISFQNGSATFHNRFVRTNGYQLEQQTQRISQRGAFQSMISGGIFSNIFNLKIKNVANTNVILWNKRLFALWEAGRPYELIPETLDTIPGESTLNNILSDPLQTFSVHPKICSHTNRLIGFTSKQGLLSCDLTFLEFSNNFTLVNSR
jgi:all-trans-8'-apo-beta-carotenal 15,15'-oxygenase